MTTDAMEPNPSSVDVLARAFHGVFDDALRPVRSDLAEIKERVGNLEARIGGLEERVGGLEQTLGSEITALQQRALIMELVGGGMSPPEGFRVLVESARTGSLSEATVSLLSTWAYASDDEEDADDG